MSSADRREWIDAVPVAASLSADVIAAWSVALASLRLRGVQAGMRPVSAVPEACSSEIARACRDGQRLAAFTPRVMVPDGDGDWRVEDMGYRGKVAARVPDVFDAMDAAAARSGGAGLTLSQVTAGRLYRALTESVAAGGVRLSRVGEAAAGPEARDWMDGYIARCDRLRAMHRAIGPGVSMAVRRVRPSVRGSRQRITFRALADMVCLGDLPLDGVLEVHGWAKGGKTRAVLRKALGEVLDRMAQA